METDYISRKAVETFLRSRNYCLDTEADIEYVVECLSKEIPAADVRPVVYCRDCEHCEIWDENNGIYYCVGGRPGSSVNPAEDFCSKAKRSGAKMGGSDGRQE